MAADKKTVENGPGRDSGGRFVPGCAAGPGRPKGSANSLLTQARQWVEERGLPLMIEAAEAGDADALKCLVTLGMPRQKPVAAGLEGLDGLPIPTTEQDMPKVIGFALERVASGVLSIGDAAALVDLCRARVGAVNVARAPRLPDELFELN